LGVHLIASKPRTGTPEIMNHNAPSHDGTTHTRVATLWAAHRQETFPEGLRWIDAPSGESVATLDHYIAGGVSTYLAVQGALDAQQRRTLTDCAAELAAVLPALTGHDAEYVARLVHLADLITRSAPGEPPAADQRF
jgi:hypothetical protein